jgi:hypothetical protein
MNDLKNKLLNNNLIKELIADSNTLAIYLGGSRLLNLELSESDYDIIVVSKDKAILGLFGAKIDVSEIDNIHLQTVYFYNILKAFNNSYENMKATDALCLLQFILPEIDYIYQSEEYITIKDIFNSHYIKLCWLCLENLLDALDKPEQNKKYIKSNYHYVCFNYILSNFILTNNLLLTSEQKENLKTIKAIRKVPIEIIESLDNSIIRRHLFYYEHYKEIYQEVISCQKKFT